MIEENDDPDKSLNINSLSFSRLIRLKEENDAHVESLCNVMYSLNKNRIKLESSVESIHKLDLSMLNKEVFLPLSSSIYVPGYVSDAEMYMVNFGGEYLAKMDKEGAINYFFRKIQKVKDDLALAKYALSEKVSRREYLRKVTADKYLEGKKKDRVQDLPTFLTP